MKVNSKGNLRFETQGTFEQLMEQFIKAQHTTKSQGYVNIKLNELMMRSGGMRRMDNENRPKEVRGDQDIVNTELSQLRTQGIMKSIIGSISTWQEIESKKIIIIYLISEGNFFNFENHMLLTDMDMFTVDYDNDLKESIIRDNQQINKIIERYKGIEARDTQVIWDKYYKELEPLMIDPTDMQKVKENIGKTPGTSKNVSNIKQNMLRYIKPEKWEQYLAILKELRAGVKKFRAPTIVDLCNYFDISKNVYDKKRFTVINLLQKTQGIDVLRTIEEDTDYGD